jgi:hypothetical protein
LRTGLKGEYLDLSGRKQQDAGENGEVINAIIYIPSKIIRMFESGRMRFLGHITHKVMRNSKPVEKAPLGRPRHR